MQEPHLIADDLVAWIEEDERVRAELVAAGELFSGYHPRMQAVHEQNADRLLAVIERIGWPTAGVVGERAADAAWRIAQHAIGRPAFMRRCAALLEQAVAAGAAPGWRLAMITDRIRVFEGRPQCYGTQFDWDEQGELSPKPIEDPNGVDERRRSVGLNTVAERQEELRAQALLDGEAPQDHAARRAAAAAWAKDVGWR